MTAPVISLTSAPNSQNPTFDTDLYLPVAGNIAYLKIGRDILFSTFDQNVAHTLAQPEIDGLGFNWDIGIIYNGINYYRVEFNGEFSNILNDTITGSIDGPDLSPQGGAWIDPKIIKVHDERKQQLKKNELALEQTIRLAHQRLSGKITEPEILKQDASPQKLAIHAEKLAKQLVEKSKDSAKQRTRNKEIIKDLQRQAAAIMQEEEEAIVMLLH